MISLHRSMHSSQMYTPGPAMSFLTCFWLLPQKEHLSRSPPSPMRAISSGPYFLRLRATIETDPTPCAHRPKTKARYVTVPADRERGRLVVGDSLTELPGKPALPIPHPAR